MTQQQAGKGVMVNLMVPPELHRKIQAIAQKNSWDIRETIIRMCMFASDVFENQDQINA